MRQLIPIVALTSILPALQGCVPAVVGGAAAVVGPTIAEERKISEVVSDAKIRSRIQDKWMDENPKIHDMAEIQVREGRVLLSGLFDTPQRQIDAVRLAWEVDGVKEVMDETQIGQDSAGNYAKDAWITTKLKTEMLFDEHISSINYNIKTVNGTVYLIGIAKSELEVQRAMNRARNISGVKDVVNYMRIKDRGATPAVYNSGAIQEEPLQEETSYPNTRMR